VDKWAIHQMALKRHIAHDGWGISALRGSLVLSAIYQDLGSRLLPRGFDGMGDGRLYFGSLSFVVIALHQPGDFLDDFQIYEAVHGIQSSIIQFQYQCTSQPGGKSPIRR
jgi:hypothetical protein